MINSPKVLSGCTLEPALAARLPVVANIRRLREPDPYKQKGVRYTGEVLKKKAGKTGAK